MKLKDIKPNPNNPRVIKDEKFEKLKKSIKDFPKMMALRPMVLDEDNVVLGGNMRLKALGALGYKEIDKSWYKREKDLTEEEKKQFIIVDNVGYGEWDWDQLANDWDSEQLNEWGLDVWQAPEDVNLDEFFEENTSEPAEPKNKIVLEYSEEEYEKIVAKFNSMDGSKENIVWKLLGL